MCKLMSHLQVRKHVHIARSYIQNVHLQAIRWRLIRSPVGQQRQMVLQILISHDIFGCLKETTDCVIPRLIRLSSTTLTTELLRLLSVIASDHKGREYLLSPGSTVIPDLFSILSTMPGSSVHRKEGVEPSISPPPIFEALAW